MAWPTMPKGRRIFADYFFTPKAQRQIRTNRIGRGAMNQIDFAGRWFYPPDARYHREQLAGPPVYQGRHRGRGRTRQTDEYQPRHRR